MWEEYLLKMYESMAHFNEQNEEMACAGWVIKDFRIAESSTHIYGVIVMWVRNHKIDITSRKVA